MKTMVATAIVAAIALPTVAQAQSNVTLYGVVDAGIAVSDVGNGSQTTVSSGIENGSRWGLRGSEDLGDGMAATFVLESGFNVDDGVAQQGGRLFGRKALLGLTGKYGSVEMGRNNSPTFYLVTPLDPFLAGAASALNLISTSPPGQQSGRVDNSIIYTSPRMSGFQGKLHYSLGEQAITATTTKNGNNSLGLSLTYSAGPILAGIAHSSRNNPAEKDKDNTTTAGLSYNFKFIKPSIIVQSGKHEGSFTAATPASATSPFSRSWVSALIGATVPVGSAGKLMFSYKMYDDKTSSDFDANQISVGYDQALSKRTNLYVNYSKLSNKGNSTYFNQDATTLYRTGMVPGYDPTLLTFGIRHTF
jgi:predicted porin